MNTTRVGAGSIKDRTTAVVAWSVCAAVALTFALHSVLAEPDPGLGPLLDVLIKVGLLMYPIVGAIVATRGQERTIGWLFLGFGFLNLLGFAGDAYAASRFGVLPGAAFGAWLNLITIQSPTLFTWFGFFLLLFPTGRLPSRRWRHPARFSAAITLLLLLFITFKPSTFDVREHVFANPVAIAALAPVWKIVETPLFLGTVMCVPAFAVSFVLRFRRSRAVERQQLKWFSLGAVVLGLTIALAPVIFTYVTLWWVWPIAFFCGATALPVAAGVGIMRYKLYDIDQIITRTLAYALITGLLVGTYLGLVVVLQGLTRPFTRGSDLAVAVSTLIVAALFRPMRRWVQRIVDRRFNRSRHDAAQTIDTFSGRLREQIDIDALGIELTEIVQRTMQPAHASLWLRRTS